MAKQLLHLVLGGELTDPTSTEFVDLSKVDVVGLFPNYAEALKAWRGKAQATIDNAHVRYFVAHLHRLLDPANPPSRRANRVAQLRSRCGDSGAWSMACNPSGTGSSQMSAAEIAARAGAVWMP